MYEDMTPEIVKARILARLTTGLQTREGSFTGDIIAAAAAEISECYHSMDALLPAFYIDATSGEYIDKQAATVGIVRKAGTAACCAIDFTGADGASVPAGTPFYTAAGLTFYLEAAVTIAGGTAKGTLLAAEAGDGYNIAAGEIVSTLRNYTGITGYANAAAAGGTDPETDEALLARYLTRMRQSPTSGNPYHYQMWAMEVSGVGAARVVSKWDGPGTVKVILADQEMQPAAETVVEACAAYIEEERPVGPAVTVEAAKSRGIAVAASVTIDGTTSRTAVQAALEMAVGGYLRGLAASAFTENIDVQMETMDTGSYTVLYNRIAYLLLSIPGVVDYTGLTVGGGTSNILVAADELPVLTEVTIS